MERNKGAYDHFTYKQAVPGGNSRKWIDRYRKMLCKYEILEEVLDMRKSENKAILKGYKMCIDVFHEHVTPKTNPPKPEPKE